MCKFALAVTLLLDHSYLLIAKFLSPGLAMGVITLCLRPGNSILGTRCTFVGMYQALQHGNPVYGASLCIIIVP